jgi:hypothetical protein
MRLEKGPPAEFLAAGTDQLRDRDEPEWLAKRSWTGQVNRLSGNSQAGQAQAEHPGQDADADRDSPQRRDGRSLPYLQRGSAVHGQHDQDADAGSELSDGQYLHGQVGSRLQYLKPAGGQPGHYEVQPERGPHADCLLILPGRQVMPGPGLVIGRHERSSGRGGRFGCHGLLPLVVG